MKIFEKTVCVCFFFANKKKKKWEWAYAHSFAHIGVTIFDFAEKVSSFCVAKGVPDFDV